MDMDTACSGLKEKVDISQRIERRGSSTEEILRIICMSCIVVTFPDA